MADHEKAALRHSLDGQQNTTLFALYKSYFQDLLDATLNGDITDIVYVNDAMDVIEDLLKSRGIILERV